MAIKDTPMKPYTNLPTPTTNLVLDIQRMTGYGWSAKIITKVVRYRYNVAISIGGEML